MCEELSEKHHAEIAELQKTLKMELEKVKAELGLLSLEKEQSESRCHDLKSRFLYPTVAKLSIQKGKCKTYPHTRTGLMV